ncbi:MAG: type ISP restriction/modification enzyme, partial [Pseudonocardiaceae bacterium]
HRKLQDLENHAHRLPSPPCNIRDNHLSCNWTALLHGRLNNPQKITFGKNGKMPDKSTIIYNSNVTITGIPAEAYGYILGSRSAIEWIMERYQVKTDKASRIVNDPNDWATEVGDPRYIINLLRHIVTVSLETIRLVKSLPALRLID